MSTCPAGHDSAADDYCDVCGLPISEADQVAAAPPAEEPAAPEPEPEPDAVCPNCGGTSPPNALFCEACGFDFTTGTAPRSSLDLDPAGAAGEPSTPVEPAAPAEPLVPEPAAADPSGAVEEPSSPAEPPAAVASDATAVAEVWIDPDWYAEQESSDPLPSAGLPTVVPLRSKSVLVGRVSRSRNIHPDIDLSSDNGVSRRHCQLTTDGTRWWVEDLGSSNGTFVGSSVGTVPDRPIPPGQKREIAPDERVYVGAWTRIVIRDAQPGEV